MVGYVCMYSHYEKTSLIGAWQYLRTKAHNPCMEASIYYTAITGSGPDLLPFATCLLKVCVN